MSTAAAAALYHHLSASNSNPLAATTSMAPSMRYSPYKVPSAVKPDGVLASIRPEAGISTSTRDDNIKSMENLVSGISTHAVGRK